MLGGSPCKADRVQSIALMISLSAFALVVGREASAALDRAPEILDHRQDAATNQIRLLWAPGGNADGTINPNVTSYTVEIKGDGYGSFASIFSADQHAMTYVDELGRANWYDSSWNPANQGASVTYRVKATTSDGSSIYSPEATFTPALPLYPPDEVLDGKVQLAWWPARTRGSTNPAPVHLGYRVQKKLPGGVWVDAHAGLLSEPRFIDPLPAIGTNVYRVLSMYAPAPGLSAVSYVLTASDPLTLTSNEQAIEIHPTCPGQTWCVGLPVIEIGDLDADGNYDGDDIAEALEQCGGMGGCVLRALPVTYDDVAITITDQAQPYSVCTQASPTRPRHCLTAGPGQLDFSNGLVIEGYGSRTVFRSPLWGTDVPAPVLEIQRQSFPVALRNLVLDGRKFEQVAPGTSAWHNWWYGGLYVWNVGPWRDEVREIAGDSLGNDDGFCDYEECSEAASGNDGDGLCEAGESCVDAAGGACNNEMWTNAITCESTKDSNDGCLHHVEVRDIPGAHAVLLLHANRWILEDNDVHDIGCVNRGYGYDCPHFDAADATVLPGFKTYGIGLSVGQYTADFQVRRNQVYRTTKYGISFKNNAAADCNGLNRNHEVAYNETRDIGAVGIFNSGSIGARIHDNAIGHTTTWNEPDAMNTYQGPFGMYLGGWCSDDNQFTDNIITDSGAMGMFWNGVTNRVTCTSPGSCAPVTVVGNTIGGNTIDGTCLEKDTGPAAGSNSFGYASIHVHAGASGPLFLDGNTLTDSQCNTAIALSGPINRSVGPVTVTVSGGSYESGPNTYPSSSFWCGAVHAYGDNRKFILDDGVAFTNPYGPAIPKACVGAAVGDVVGATGVIDDASFAPGQFTAPVAHGGTMVDCSTTSHPDCD